MKFTKENLIKEIEKMNKQIVTWRGNEIASGNVTTQVMGGEFVDTFEAISKKDLLSLIVNME